MKTVTATALREECAEALNAAAYRDERVIITKHGKPVAALISADDLEMFEALEDAADLGVVRRRLAEPDESVALEEALGELGL